MISQYNREQLNCAFEAFYHYLRTKGSYSKSFEYFIANTYIAGGAARDAQLNQVFSPRDYDFYCVTQEAVDEIEAVLPKNPETYTQGYFGATLLSATYKKSAGIPEKSNYGYTIRAEGFDTPINFITKFVGEPGIVCKKFDFHNCQAYFRYNELRVTFKSPEAINLKYLSYDKENLNEKSIARYLKFVGRGFETGPKHLMQFLMDVDENLGKKTAPVSSENPTAREQYAEVLVDDELLAGYFSEQAIPVNYPTLPLGNLVREQRLFDPSPLWEVSFPNVPENVTTIPQRQFTVSDVNTTSGTVTLAGTPPSDTLRGADRAAPTNPLVNLLTRISENGNS